MWPVSSWNFRRAILCEKHWGPTRLALRSTWMSSLGWICICFTAGCLLGHVYYSFTMSNNLRMKSLQTAANCSDMKSEIEGEANSFVMIFMVEPSIPDWLFLNWSIDLSPDPAGEELPPCESASSRCPLWAEEAKCFCLGRHIWSCGFARFLMWDFTWYGVYVP